MKSSFIAIAVLALASVTLGMSTAYADKMKCKSSGDFVRCALPNANHRHVNLHEETSHNKCEKGYTWGADSDGIWVDKKCKAGQVIVRQISGVMNVPITGMVTKPVKMMAR